MWLCGQIWTLWGGGGGEHGVNPIDCSFKEAVQLRWAKPSLALLYHSYLIQMLTIPMPPQMLLDPISSFSSFLFDLDCSICSLLSLH